MSITDLYKSLSNKSKVPFTKRDIERILSSLLISNNIWDIIDKSHTPIKLACEILNAFLDKGILKVDGESLTLTDFGIQIIKEEGIASHKDYFSCSICKGRGISNEKLSFIFEQFKKIAENRPSALQKYDQGHITEDTSLARIAFIWSKGDLENKNLIIFGDDDLLSIVAGLTKAAKSIVVFEIDQRIIEFIDNVSKDLSLGIQVIQLDLREPIPDRFRASFETFISDPPESSKGMFGFLEKGIFCLKGQGSAGYFGMTRGESSLFKWQRVQKYLLKLGACFTDLIPDFSHYVNWNYITRMRSWDWLPVKVEPEKIWYRSSLCRIEIIEEMEYQNNRITENILIDEETATT